MCKVTAERNTVDAFGSGKFEASLFSLYEMWDKLSESASPGEWNMEKCRVAIEMGNLDCQKELYTYFQTACYRDKLRAFPNILQESI